MGVVATSVVAVVGEVTAAADATVAVGAEVGAFALPAHPTVIIMISKADNIQFLLEVCWVLMVFLLNLLYLICCTAKAYELYICRIIGSSGNPV